MLNDTVEKVVILSLALHVFSDAFKLAADSRHNVVVAIFGPNFNGAVGRFLVAVERLPILKATHINRPRGYNKVDDTKEKEKQEKRGNPHNRRDTLQPRQHSQ